MTDAFTPKSIDELPTEIPIFPLSGALLLPRGWLPLNIFEPRYLSMVRSALAQEMRLIGMVQPRPHPEGGLEGNSESSSDPQNSDALRDIYQIGCAGRISSFSETDDGRFLITLKGVSRFRVLEEVPLDPDEGFRRLKVDWQPFGQDIHCDGEHMDDRQGIMRCLKQYLVKNELVANWEAVENASDVDLISSLCMVSSFSVAEKQALLEASDTCARAKVLTTLINMSMADCGPMDLVKN